MKKFMFTLAILILAANFHPAFAGGGEKTAADEKIFVVFENFDRDTINNTVYDFYNQLYRDPLQVMPNFGVLVESLPFSDATFANHKITDYRAAFFPVGRYPLTWSTPGGIRLIDKIMEMIDAGKDVVIIGNNILWWSLDAASGSYGKDPKVNNLLTNILGIKYDGKFQTSHVEGSTIYFDGFVAYGTRQDTVVQGYRKHCNMIYTENNATNEAWRYYTHIDVFKLKNDPRLIPMEHLNDENAETLVGMRTQYNGSKIAIWSISYDITCEKLHTQFGLWGSLVWFMSGKTLPWPYLEFFDNPLAFDEVQINSPFIKETKIRNYGEQDLVIEKMEIEGWEEKGVFEIVEGGGQMTLKPMQEHTIKVKFIPFEKKTYSDYLSITSNAWNGEYVSIELTGTGDQKSQQGPKLAMSVDTLDYGIIKLGKRGIEEVTLSSVGTSQLIIEDIELVENEDNAYDFLDGTSDTPLVLEPGESHVVRIRFFPVVKDVVFRGKILVKTNGKVGERENYFYLKGMAGDVYLPKLTVSENILDFGSVNKGEKGTKDVTLNNTGNADLIISSIEFLDNDDNAFSYTGADNPPITIGVAGSKILTVEFNPTTDRESFIGRLSMKTNEPEGSNIKIIEMSGKNITTSVDDNYTASKLKINITPQPVTNASSVTIESDLNEQVSAAVTVYNTLGTEVVQPKMMALNTGSNSVSIPFELLPAGAYTLAVKVSGKIITYKFIKK